PEPPTERRFQGAGVRSGSAGPGPVLVALGGTARNLGRIYQRKVRYPLELLHGLSVPAPALHEIYLELAKMPLEERKAVPGLSPARADIIVAGAAVVDRVAATIGARELVVSGCGLREGLFHGELRGTSNEADAGDDPAALASRNLMRRFQVDES